MWKSLVKQNGVHVQNRPLRAGCFVTHPKPPLDGAEQEAVGQRQIGRHLGDDPINGGLPVMH